MMVMKNRLDFHSGSKLQMQRGLVVVKPVFIQMT